MTEAWLAFFGGIVATLVGALIASLVQRHRERIRRREQIMLDAYFHLIDLNNWYFWVASKELHGEDPPDEVLVTCRETALKLNDKLRSYDDFELLEETLEVLFAENLGSANERANRISALIGRYGKVVNPRYSDAMAKISASNVLRHASLEKLPFNAPGSWQYARPNRRRSADESPR